MTSLRWRLASSLTGHERLKSEDTSADFKRRSRAPCGSSITGPLATYHEAPTFRAELLTPHGELRGGVRSGVNPSLGARGMGARQSVRLDGGAEGAKRIEKEEVREEAREAITLHWAEDLASAIYGRWTLDAVGPVLNGWLNRWHGCLSMRLVQVLSGHGCFGSYLHRIGREENPKCHHCEATVDTAEHTLQVCSSWAVPRRALMAVVGNDLSLLSVIAAILGSEEAWEVVASFCEDIMPQKEAALAVPLRKRRRGRRRQTRRPSSSAPGGDQRATGAGAPPPAAQLGI
ncbi:hypothetical protein B5X24_HaOG207179 [Helicoverpa armigera]|nr:hypothetical protein B5X24_HaOG207179 [Helicoverpa armigera]